MVIILAGRGNFNTSRNLKTGSDKWSQKKGVQMGSKTKQAVLAAQYVWHLSC
jgi:hypothetical protein